jgi:uncharacterized repeat protein (TIGR01451 family)
VVTQICPITPILQGGILTYSGTVSNAGNITLTNIIVMSDRPAANTVIFTRASLLPGASASFSGSYQVPTNCCVVSSTVKGSGQGCVGETVTDTATRTCTVLTTPAIVVTKVCVPGALRPGDLLTYSGTVRNSGNITLINVTVVNNFPVSNSPVIGPITLAPGESAPYTVSYIVPVDFCGTDTVTASGLDVCTFAPVSNSVTSTCPVTFSPRIAVTKNCPASPTQRGGLFVFTGTVSNTGDVTLNNVYVTNSKPTNNAPVIGPITLAPGQTVNFSGSYIAPTCCCFMIDTLTARGQDRCAGSNVTSTATAVCPLLSNPGLALIQTCPPVPSAMGSVYNYSGYVTNSGDVVLTNVFVFGPQGSSTVVLGPIELAPGEIEFYSGSYTIPANTCSATVTTSGRDTCGGNLATNSVSCPVATTPVILITQNCPPGPVTNGSNVAYTGTVRNIGNITLTNVFVFGSQPNAAIMGPITLIPGASAPFSGNYTATGGSNPTTNSSTGVVSYTPTNTVRTTGMDICQARTVTAAADCQGPVASPSSPSMTTGPATGEGEFTLSFPTTNGETYTVQYKNALGDSTWTDLETVTGTGGVIQIIDEDSQVQPSRFYRVIIAQ